MILENRKFPYHFYSGLTNLSMDPSKPCLIYFFIVAILLEVIMFNGKSLESSRSKFDFIIPYVLAI